MLPTSCDRQEACRLLLWLTVLLCQTLPLRAEETADEEPLWRVTLTASAISHQPSANNQQTVEGRILVEAADGGILLEDRAGVIWNITPDQMTGREQTGTPFAPMTADELGARLREELGASFQIVTTQHYVIATAGSRVHAEWCGVMFERLLKAFIRYWRAADLQIKQPLVPLPVIVHKDRTTFANFASDDAGAAFAEANGYYSMRSNRIVLFDLTQSAIVKERIRSPVRTRADVQRMMAVDPTPLSTIVHEATHQIAFNSGIHTRYADNPVWLTEGMALFFEVPDLRNRSGWRTIGRINRPRLTKFRQSVKNGRPADSLNSLIADDERFRNPETTEFAYAEAWLLTYFLMKTRRHQYVLFLGKCSHHTHLDWKTRDERLQLFKEAFGSLPTDLETDFLRYAARLR